MVPTSLPPVVGALGSDERSHERSDERPDEITDELAYVRAADAADHDPARRARRASREAAAYLSARRRRLRQQLRADG